MNDDDDDGNANDSDYGGNESDDELNLWSKRMVKQSFLTDADFDLLEPNEQLNIYKELPLTD